MRWKNKRYMPENMTPVAMMLVTVVPSLLAIMPPIRGVHVLFKLNAEISRLNSVLDVFISRESRDFSGPSVYDAL